MTKSQNIFTIVLFVVGVLIIVLNSTITGAVTGLPKSEFSFFFVLIGLFFILTSLIVFVTSQFKTPYVYSVEDDHPEPYDDEDIDSEEKDIDFDDVKSLSKAKKRG